MKSVAQIEEALQRVMTERANILAVEMGVIRRVRKFTGAALLHCFVFGWLMHAAARLEQLASTAAEAGVVVTDTAVQKRFTPECAEFLHVILQELTACVTQGEEEAPSALLKRFSAVIIEESSVIVLPMSLAKVWQGCGGTNGACSASVKVHVRWELNRGQIWGPSLTDGRVSDHRSPFAEHAIIAWSLYIADLGYFSIQGMQQRRQQRGSSLTRLRSKTVLFTPTGQRVELSHILPRRVGQMKEMRVQVGGQRYPMRLLMLRVPRAVAEQRREEMREEAKRRQTTVSEEALALADWTLLLTDVPAKRLSFEEALVLLRQRWQVELLFKLWKSEGLVDEWRTEKPERILCEVYAKLIGLLLQHWLIVAFAWQDDQRSCVKLARVVRDTVCGLLQALHRQISWSQAFERIQRRMQAGCQMNKRRKHPNSGQLLEDGLEWSLSWCE